MTPPGPLPAGRRRPSISFVVVTWRCAEAVRASLPALAGELGPDDELIVVDNASGDGTLDAARQAAPDALLIEAPDNLGYGAGCNLGAREAGGELLCFLNPDAVVEAGFAREIARPLTDGLGWGAWQGLVTQAGGTLVNTSGGVVHFTGIAWAGDAGRPLPAAEGAGPAGEPAGRAGEPGFVSGACLAIPHATFRRAGGFCESFFLYHEDVELSLRLRLAGERLGVATAARVEHDYEFDKGGEKWRYLERNRQATLALTYPLGLLAVLAPALLATELALLVIAARGGWLGRKLAAWGEFLRALPRLVATRRRIRAAARIGAAEFARPLVSGLDSPYLGGAASSRALSALLASYWSVSLRLLEAGSSSAPPRSAASERDPSG